MNQTTQTNAPAAQAQAPAAKAKTPRRSRAKAANLTANASAPGDTLPAVSASAPANAQASAEARAEAAVAESARLQKLLRETQGKLAEATKDTEPPAPISDADLKPLMAEHVRTGASIGRHALTTEQKLAWKASKKARKLAINGRIYRKRVLGNVTRAANEGAFSRYRERVSAKSKRLAGFTLGASFADPKAKK